MATPGMPFNQMMGTPVELTLRSTEAGLRLFANPIQELRSLRARSHKLQSQPLDSAQNPLREIKGELFDIDGEVTVGQATEIGLTVRGVPVVYDARKGEISCQGQTGGLQPSNGKIRLRLLVDRTSLELFGNDGWLYMSVGVIVPAADNTLALYAKGPGAKLDWLEVHELKSAWP